MQNKFDRLPPSTTPVTKLDASAVQSIQSAPHEHINYLTQPPPANQAYTAPSNRTDKPAMGESALESPTRTQLLTKLSALTNESVDSLRLNTALASALDRYPDRISDALEYFHLCDPKLEK